VGRKQDAREDRITKYIKAGHARAGIMRERGLFIPEAISQIAELSIILPLMSDGPYPPEYIEKEETLLRETKALGLQGIAMPFGMASLLIEEAMQIPESRECFHLFAQSTF